MRTKTVYPNNRGFTLIELLVAMVILAVITLTMFTAFNTFMKTSDRIRMESDFSTRFQTGFRTMIDDLEQVYLVRSPEYQPPEFGDPDPFRFEATREIQGGISFSRLRFSSLNHLPMGNGGNQCPPATITYYVRYNGGTFSLHRSDTQEGKPEAAPCPDPVLFEHVEKFDLKFSNGEDEYQDTWNSDAKEHEYSAPRKIQLSITVKENSREHTISTTLLLPQIRGARR